MLFILNSAIKLDIKNDSVETALELLNKATLNQNAQETLLKLLQEQAEAIIALTTKFDNAQEKEAILTKELQITKTKLDNLEKQAGVKSPTDPDSIEERINKLMTSKALSSEVTILKNDFDALKKKITDEETQVNNIATELKITVTGVAPTNQSATAKVLKNITEKLKKMKPTACKMVGKLVVNLATVGLTVSSAVAAQNPDEQTKAVILGILAATTGFLGAYS